MPEPGKKTMPDLGKKYECYNCRTKFYNLGKPDAICPRCGANQKDAKSDDAPAPTPRPPRRSAVLMEPLPDETPAEFGEEGPAPEPEEDRDEEDEADEEEQITDAGPPPREEEEEY